MKACVHVCPRAQENRDPLIEKNSSPAPRFWEGEFLVVFGLNSKFNKVAKVFFMFI